MTLTEFLLARIEGDENLAQMAGHGCGYLHAHNAGWVEVDFPDEHNARPSYELRFISYFDPARVLAECEAKRRIVDEHPPQPTGHCATCTPPGHTWYDFEPDFTVWPCPTIAALAAVYADHPDYREEWKP